MTETAAPRLSDGRGGARWRRRGPAEDRFAFTGRRRVDGATDEAAFVEDLRRELKSESELWGWVEVAARGPGWAEYRGRIGRGLLHTIAFGYPWRFVEYRVRVAFDLSRDPVPVRVEGRAHPTAVFALTLAVAMAAVFVYLTGLFLAGLLLAGYYAERDLAERLFRRVLVEKPEREEWARWMRAIETTPGMPPL